MADPKQIIVTDGKPEIVQHTVTTTETPKTPPAVQSATYTLSDVAFLLGIVGAVLVIVKFVTDWMKGKDDKEEKAAAKFQQALDHEKSNRQQNEKILKDSLTKAEDTIVQIKIDQGVMRAKHEELEGDIQEIKDLIKDKFDELKEYIKERTEQ